MNIFGWIRDLFGIQKDMYETKKTRLEIEKIEDEKREKLITPATLAEVKKYDPKTKSLFKKIAGTTWDIALLVILVYALVKVLTSERVAHLIEPLARIFR